MRISLIGMAGTGKSTWAKRFQAYGFQRIDCDRMIAERLSSNLHAADDLIAALGSWMGLPWEPGYEDRAAQYHREEMAVMQEALAVLATTAPRGDVVVDTAGSVIYTGASILRELIRQTTVVHLETPPEVQERMLEEFLERPGPVLWQGMFRKASGESERQALARCYPRLLADREKRYRALAHVSLPHAFHKEDAQGVEDLMARVRKEMQGRSDLSLN
ncbi:MAG: dephospho-CoA kinase [Desulfobacteraceae bacterium]|jgi:shikimate kinase